MSYSDEDILDIGGQTLLVDELSSDEDDGDEETPQSAENYQPAMYISHPPKKRKRELTDGFDYSYKQSSEDEAGTQQTFSVHSHSSGYETGERSTESPSNEMQPKKLKREWVNSYSNTAVRIMQQMGFQPDKGLGKDGQGRLEPVEASKQEGRRGLGLKLKGIDGDSVDWNPETEKIQIPELMDWLNSEIDDLYDITMTHLSDWEVVGPPKLEIDDETKFCDPEILSDVLKSKNFFDQLAAQEIRSARTRSNPFETIRSSIFLNRAAVKMANIDSLCDMMFTSPKDEKGESLVRPNDLLYFADICAGPGGFSEYVLFRKNWEAKGFGFTLKESNDFKLENFYAGSPETFDPYYGIKDDGNIFDPENIISFKEYVLDQTESGVHFVMADGGFSVEGQENIQEILSKQLYLCQCLVALSILRDQGHFVVKLFDLFTPFSVGLVYLMYKCFKKICICKPNTSRPANSERYLICKWKKPQTSIIERHLFDINQRLWDKAQSKDDEADETMEIVRYEELIKDQKFCEYIIESNNRMGRNQSVGLVKIAKFCNDKTLREERQAEIKRECLILWNLPDRPRQDPKIHSMSNDELLDELLKEWRDDKKFLRKPPEELAGGIELRKYFPSIYDWSFVPIGRDESMCVRTFFLSKGRQNVSMYVSNGNWQPLHGCCLEMTPKTLVYGEIVRELTGEGRSQNSVLALHIIDGIALGGVDIRRYPLRERMKMCEKFARALSKPIKVNPEGISLAPIRSKKLFSFTQFNSFFDEMRVYKLKNISERLGYRIRTNNSNQQERFFVPGGLLFVNEHSPRFTCNWSKSYNTMYYYDIETKDSCFVKDFKARELLYASFRAVFFTRKEWRWANPYQVSEDGAPEGSRDPKLLYRVDFNDFIHSHFHVR